MAHNRKVGAKLKIGILTLHSQINYGGVLQAYALQEVLMRLGHDVQIVDRWLDERNGGLRGIVASRSIVSWIKFIARALLGFGDAANYIRHVRTARKLHFLFKRTEYSFCHWKDAPSDFNFDLLVVGSDQVWNSNLQGKELPYLLEGAPATPAIAYAASFGMKRVPIGLQARYKEGFARFSQISVREKEACSIVNEAGFTAEHVADPTLLMDLSDWNRIMAVSQLPKKRIKRKLVCYLIHDPLGFVISKLSRFAKDNDCEVEIFFGTPCTLLPKNFYELFAISSGASRAFFAKDIHTRATATPDEFLSEIASADMVLSDSFHALMFATIFRKNVRILKPRDDRGSAGFSRLSEFVDSFIETPTMYDDFEKALLSFRLDPQTRYSEPKISDFRKESFSWLKSSIQNAVGKLG